MNQPLEDHGGDILRKARLATTMNLSQAAAHAGLTLNEYEAWEDRGTGSRPPDFERLARALGLDGAKLRRIAEGWKPGAVDLERWREIRRITTSRDDQEVNCYLVWDEVGREAALFDTGWAAEPVLELIRNNDLTMRHLFLSHTHDDHMTAMGDLRTAFPKLKLHTNSPNVPPQHRNLPQDFLHLGNMRVTNRATPGHSADGVIYVVGNWPEDAPHVAFVGDTLFAGSLATGMESLDLLKKSVREQIFSLPDTTLICPGHGPMTTVGEEKRHNPFFI